jgi:hypothetical protein
VESNKDAEKVNEMKRVGAKEGGEKGGEEKKDNKGDGTQGPPTVHTIC